jgi:hypothetical protein
MSIETNYIRFTDVKINYAEFFIGKKMYLPQEKIINELNLANNDYIWCVKKNNKITKVDTPDSTKKILLLVSRAWLNDQIKIKQKKKDCTKQKNKVIVEDNQSTDNHLQKKNQNVCTDPIICKNDQNLPNDNKAFRVLNGLEKELELIRLTDIEKFKDNKGNIIDVLCVGQRDRNNIFFCFNDAKNKFDIQNEGLRDTVTRKDGSYREGRHYKYLSVNGKQKLFLTYRGLRRVLDNYTSNITEAFNDWGDDILFTSQFGTDDDKINMVVNKLGVDVKSIKKMMGLSKTKVSAIYLYALGTVKELRKALNIPTVYHDDLIIYKFGLTEDLKDRGNQHESAFKEMKIKFFLIKFEIIDPEYLSKAETELKKFFKSKQYHYTCTDITGANRTEFIITDKKEVDGPITNEYIRVGDMFSNTIKAASIRNELIVTELKDALSNIEKIHLRHQVELCNLDKDHKLELLERDRQLLERDRQLDNLKKDSIIALEREQHKNEILAQKYLLIELKLKHGIID